MKKNDIGYIMMFIILGILCVFNLHISSQNSKRVNNLILELKGVLTSHYNAIQGIQMAIAGKKK
jgi:hypothetical protein